MELRTIPFVDAASSMQGQEEEETVAQELLTLTVVRPEDIPLPDSPVSFLKLLILLTSINLILT